MSRSRGGSGRHRQPWIEATCECCGQPVTARRTLPGRPLHARAHFTSDGDLCGCSTVEKVLVS